MTVGRSNNQWQAPISYTHCPCVFACIYKVKRFRFFAAGTKHQECGALMLHINTNTNTNTKKHMLHKTSLLSRWNVHRGRVFCVFLDFLTTRIGFWWRLKVCHSARILNWQYSVLKCLNSFGAEHPHRSDWLRSIDPSNPKDFLSSHYIFLSVLFNLPSFLY